MRGATVCAKRLKLLFSSLRSKLGKVGRPPVTDPITQLILGVLSRNTPEAKASEGLDRLRTMVVDYNELRVIPVLELVEILGDFPDARLKCEDISRALNAIFALEHAISLDQLAGLPKKEVIAVLERVEGLEAYTRARIRLLGLGQHAIPLDEAMWAWARERKVVDPRCELLEAQQFLERQIAEEDALEFVALFKRSAWSDMGAAAKRGEVPRILSVPPDRTSRNMLQMVSRDASAADDRAASGAPSDDVPSGTVASSAAPAEAGANSAPRRRKTTRAAATKRSRKTRAGAGEKRKPKTRKAVKRTKTAAKGSRTRAKRPKSASAKRAKSSRPTRRAKQTKRSAKRVQTAAKSRAGKRKRTASATAQTKSGTKRPPRGRQNQLDANSA